MSSFSFQILHTDKKSAARTGKITTTHGTVDTPTLVPVGTKASIKSLTPQDLNEIGVQILFGNTYHLHLRPGEEIVKTFGGLGQFMHYNGVTMTDSGGFQVFSLARNRSQFSYVIGDDQKFQKEKRENPSSLIEKSPAQEEMPQLVKITDDGVEFRSHLDGSKHFFTPEQSIRIQKKLGADIMLAFDDCPPFPITYEGAKKAMELTHAWAIRSLNEYKKTKNYFPQALYGIVQGSVFKDLREQSAKTIGAMDFDGIAIGGVAVGEGKKEMQQAVDWTVPFLPQEKIRHLLGVGDVDDIFAIVERGIDTFDCVTPTRLGRVGVAFVHPGEGNRENRFRFDLTKSEYATSREPLSRNCHCMVCQEFTRGYMHHLFRAKELLAYRLLTYHNIFFFTKLLEEIRAAILQGEFQQLKKKWLDR
ncbi:MAG: tRNA guanosine(34) transglycosylase Tgt [Candidatus Levyibacteriota bacterium]